MRDPSIGGMKALGAALRDQQGALTERWMKIVFGDADVEHSDRLTHRQLADHLPAIFNEVCDVLQLDDPHARDGALEHDAREHGKWRWSQGYRIDELVRELDLFRQVLIWATGEFASAEPDVFERPHEVRACLLIDEVLSFVTLTSIRQSVSERERKIDEYTGMLERANQELTLRERLISELYESRMQVTRRVSHDLRNFLNVFSTALQLVKRSPSKREAAIALAARQAADMGTLVDEMVEYSKVLGDDSGLSVEPFDLNGLFEELIDACRAPAEAKGLVLKGRVDPALGTVTSNRLKTKQIAYNLLSNAIKYTHSGEVDLQMLADGDSHWRLRVSDTGVGISPQDHARVFGAFERATSEDIPGSGLGLAIVEELARMLHGTIEFESFKGQGSVFELRVPRVLESEAPR